MLSFGDEERKIRYLLSAGNMFEMCGEKYVIIISGKPTCRDGEPKADIYVLAKSEIGVMKEIKISFKKENADFIENKTNSERAELLLGSNWQEIISEATRSISAKFENKKLIYKVRSGKTGEGSITLGWKYELLNKSGGELSGKVELTQGQVIDVYAGSNLTKDKRNASVNGRIIENSGIANYILINDNLNTIQEVIGNLITVYDYVDSNPTVYFACKALNYRTYHQKYDGNRPLAVYIDWNVYDGKLTHALIYDNPLIVKGDEVAEKLKKSMNALEIVSTKDIDDSMVKNPSIICK